MANQKKSSSSKYQKKAVKTAKKMAKKNPKAFLIIVLVLVILIGAGLAVYFLFLKDKIGGNTSTSSSEPVSGEVSSQSSHNHAEHAEYNPKLETPSGISINFLELGSWYTGDCTYIKAGDADILIDAGSRQSSAKTIKEFVDQYCEDGKLEYVIATHAHQDHIAGFVGTKADPGIFESYKIGTLIDFALTNISLETDKGNPTLYGNYVAKRTAAIDSGDIEHHFTAAECIAESGEAKKEYVINDSVKMEILDQKFYHPVTDKSYFPELDIKNEEEAATEQKKVDENDYSVCALFTHNQNHYLFTGDLEGEGEASLVDLNSDLPHCQLFKGGHHGSKTSNTEKLLNKIQPEVVCICCCCGNDEYTKENNNQFPTQTAINNIAKYTQEIFVTTISTDNDKKTYTSMNGNICFKCENGKDYTVAGSNNSVILKDTEWFKTNRIWPSA